MAIVRIRQAHLSKGVCGSSEPNHGGGTADAVLRGLTKVATVRFASELFFHHPLSCNPDLVSSPPPPPDARRPPRLTSSLLLVPHATRARSSRLLRLASRPSSER